MGYRDKGVGRGLSVIVCTVLLAGCAIPMPVQIASWALDGISFLATEKSITDHGLSVVAQKDCALWRGLKGEDVCSDVDDAGTFAIAAAEDTISTPSENEEDIASLANFETAAGTSEPAPAVVHEMPKDSIDGQRLMITGKRIWTDRLDANLYFVIGSFSNRNYARRMVGKHKDLGPAVMASRLDGVEIYRVAVGPFTREQKRNMRLRLKQAGVGNAWAMRIDHRDWVLASPTVLSTPAKSVAEVPVDPKKLPAAPKRGKADEIAETPDEQAPSRQSSRLIESDKRYLVIGSFSNADNARNFAKTRAELAPRVLSAETAEGWRFRVVVGPYAKAEGIDVRRRLARAGIDQIWALNLQPDAIISDTLLAEDPDQQHWIDGNGSDEIAETPAFDGSDQAKAPSSSGEDMGWGVNLVKNIVDMFRSSDSTDIVGVIASLES